MASNTIASKIFTVTPSATAQAQSRAVRRILIHPDVLTSAKLCAGDVVALVNAENPTEETKPFAVGIAWPSPELSSDSLEASTCLLRTAKLDDGSKAHIVPLAVKQIPHGLPNIRSAQNAHTVRLREVATPDSSIQTAIDAPSRHERSGTRVRGGKKDEAGKKANWLVLLLRELLVDLKYLTPSQVLVVTYEGSPRSFIVTAVSDTPSQPPATTDHPKSGLVSPGNRRPTNLGLEDAFGQLAVVPEQAHPLWTVSWDTTVLLEQDAAPRREGTRTTSIGVSRQPSSASQYPGQSIPSTASPIPMNAGERLSRFPGSVRSAVSQAPSAMFTFPEQQPPAPNTYDTVGGLDKQIAQVRDLLDIPLTRPELFRHFGLKPPRGVLLHGPPGTGKTHLARAIAASTRSAVIIVNGPELSSAYHGETEARLRGVFEVAKEQSPCIVVLDEIDALCPRREDAGGGEVEKRVVATLLTIMDGFEVDGEGSAIGAAGDGDGMARVVVVATTNRPNAIDPALRRPGRFDREIEIGIPDAPARLSILNVLLSRTPHSLTQADLRSVANRAHGYVGADLSAVVREAGTRAIKRWLATQPSGFTRPGLAPKMSSDVTDTPASGHATEDALGEAARDAPALTQTDLLLALPSVRPSALRSLYLPGTETPVKYADVGGLAEVVQKLRECVEWPLQHPEAFVRLGVRAPRGVLLYGPPGCSKTMLVRALATESGVNFVSVKGPELLSKFVGDSERAVREIFRKARGVAPCILFFDEVDALAMSRQTDGSPVTGGVLTSLLTEMDGVQEMGLGVTVLAATNRPEALDLALMRPGRLDRLIYVGLPDRQGREEILRIRIRNMSIGPDVYERIGELADAADGCSGAEIVALCQEAAMMTMRENMQSPYVPMRAFLAAAKASRRQITSEVIAGYKRWGSLL